MWVTNLKIAGIVLGTLLVYTVICNKIPQLESSVPQKLALGANATPDELVAAGEQLYNGIGNCTSCHGLGVRAPNLLTDEKGAGLIGQRCGKREAGKTCKEYLYERLDQPGKVLLPGYQPIMPVITKQLPPNQVWSLIAFLESQGGTVDVTGADIEASEKAAGATGGGAAPASAGFASGSTQPKAIIDAAGCTTCHTIDGAGGAMAPDLTHVGSRRDAASIRRKILDPSSSIAKGYESFAGVMPKDFGTKMNAAQLESLVQYLAGHK
ncbi:MAG TPA: c-type cytochrome [Gemmatimonadales bacterium]|nr:c-type cytochrome [Gemmatimonadales bacterium]